MSNSSHSLITQGNESMSAVDSPVERARAGFNSSSGREEHAKALADLARDHDRNLLRFLTVRTGSADAAKEVLQEAYAKLLELDRPETVSFLKGYLWKLAKNLAINRSKQRANRVRLDRVALFGMQDSAPSPEALLCEQQRLELMERAIDKLPPKCLGAFVLKVQHGLTYKEVAERLNIAPRTAQLHVAQALKYCQAYLDAADNTEVSK
jgi:RNA polymerase sigma factor (sigma-70 family)